jgi:hypothetical protein
MVPRLELGARVTLQQTNGRADSLVQSIKAMLLASVAASLLLVAPVQQASAMPMNLAPLTAVHPSAFHYAAYFWKHQPWHHHVWAPGGWRDGGVKKRHGLHAELERPGSHT